MPSYPPQLNPGAFVPTTNIWDPSELYTLDIQPEFRELLVRLYQNLNNMSLLLNLKDTGYYTLEEFLNSQAFFPNPALSSTTPQTPVFRQGFRKLIQMGTLPNNGTISIAHGIAIQNTYSFTRIYGAASDQTGLNFIPLPYASPTLANNIEVRVDGTNVVLTTGSNRTNFTISYVIVEYIKS